MVAAWQQTWEKWSEAGGAEVAFDVPGFSRDMVVMLQGLIVLFSGAMTYVIAPLVAGGLRLLPGVSGARRG